MTRILDVDEHIFLTNKVLRENGLWEKTGPSTKLVIREKRLSEKTGYKRKEALRELVLREKRLAEKGGSQRKEFVGENRRSETTDLLENDGSERRSNHNNNTI